ncbi:hypothetical protein [uncultured Christiangramia sp.]|uniref:hypothetical protein n=1 Tax=Christiangramia sp. 3-2217-3z TaxID=3417564 RepID=UPI00262007CC|nr:hypothetical protein [uncultured Christiangramia sp.]
MRNLTLFIVCLFVGWSVSAENPHSEISKSTTYSNLFNDSFIFIEGGVEFAVYPNGEFDFYYNPDFRRGNEVRISTPNVNISYNSGYNYEPFIQYDDYGAVIQIEDVPVYYDYYGRIIQAGNIVMDYNRYGMLANVGSLRLHYNNFGRVIQRTGYINSYNRHYVRRPWHSYYRRPSLNVSIVFNQPYRAYYQPHRVSYNQYTTVYNNYYSTHKHKRNFYRPSQRVAQYHYGKQVKQKRDLAQYRARTNKSDQLVRNRQQAARSKAYANRSNNSKSSRIITAERSPIKNNRSKNYGARSERSTNSKGRVSPESRKTSSRTIERNSRLDTRSTENRVQKASRSTSVRNTERTPKVQNKTRSVERNTSAQRPNRQKAESTRTRSSSRSKSSVNERKNISSRARGSARNMNNI